MDIIKNKNGILLTPNSITNIEYLLHCVKYNILVFRYNYKWTLKKFNQKLRNFIIDNNIKLNSLKIFGWIFHGQNEENLHILNNSCIDLNSKTNIVQLQFFIDIITIIKPYLVQYIRLDLFACNIGKNNYLVDVLNFFEKIIEIKIAYSNDITGNILDSNWILEKYNIDLLPLYFLKKKIYELKKKNINISLFGASFGATSGMLSIMYPKLETLNSFLTTDRDVFRNDILNITNNYIHASGPLGALGLICDLVSFAPPPLGTIAGLASTGLGFIDMGIKLAKGENVPVSMIMDNIICGGLACCSIASAATKINKIAKIANSAQKLTLVGKIQDTAKTTNGMCTYMNTIFSTMKVGTFYDKGTKTYDYIRILEGVCGAMNVAISTSGIDNIVIPGRLQLACSGSCYLHNKFKNTPDISANNESFNTLNIVSYLEKSLEQYYGSGTINDNNNETVIRNLEAMKDFDNIDYTKLGYDALEFFYGEKTWLTNKKINNIRLNPRTFVKIGGVLSYVNDSLYKTMYLSFVSPITTNMISFHTYNDIISNIGTVKINMIMDGNNLNISNPNDPNNSLFDTFVPTKTIGLETNKIINNTLFNYDDSIVIKNYNSIKSINIGPLTYVYILNTNNNIINTYTNNDTSEKYMAIPTTDTNSVKICVSRLNLFKIIKKDFSSYIERIYLFNNNDTGKFLITSAIENTDNIVIGPYTTIIIKNNKNDSILYGNTNYNNYPITINKNDNIYTYLNNITLISVYVEPIINYPNAKLVISPYTTIIIKNNTDNSILYANTNYYNYPIIINKDDNIYTHFNSNNIKSISVNVEPIISNQNASLVIRPYTSIIVKNNTDNRILYRNTNYNNYFIIINKGNDIYTRLSSDNIKLNSVYVEPIINCLHANNQQVVVTNDNFGDLGNMHIIDKFKLQGCNKISKSDINVINAILTPNKHIVLFVIKKFGSSNRITCVIDVISNNTSNFMTINFQNKFINNIDYKIFDTVDPIYIGITNDVTGMNTCIYNLNDCLLYNIKIPVSTLQYSFRTEYTIHPFFLFTAKKDNTFVQIAEPPNNGYFASSEDKTLFTTNGKSDYNNVFNAIPKRPLIAYSGTNIVTQPTVDIFTSMSTYTKFNDGNIYCLFPPGNYSSIILSTIYPIPAGRTIDNNTEGYTTFTLYKYNDSKNFKPNQINYEQNIIPTLNDNFNRTQLQKVRTYTLRERNTSNNVSNVTPTSIFGWKDINLSLQSSHDSSIITSWILSDDYYKSN